MPIFTYTENGWQRAIASEFDQDNTWKSVTQVYCMRTENEWEPIYDADSVEWVVGEWSNCSATCGGGTRNRTVSCKSVATGQEIARSFCAYLVGNEPTDQELCNTDPCSQCYYQVTGDYGWVYAWVTKEAAGASELWWNGELIFTGTFGQPTININGVTYSRGQQQKTVADPDNPGSFYSVYEVCFASTRECRPFTYTNQGTNLNTMVDGFYHRLVNEIFQEKIVIWNGNIIYSEIGDNNFNSIVVGGYKYSANTSGAFSTVQIDSVTSAQGYDVCRETTLEDPTSYCPTMGVYPNGTTAANTFYAYGEFFGNSFNDIRANSRIYWNNQYIGPMTLSGGQQLPTTIGRFTYYLRGDWPSYYVTLRIYDGSSIPRYARYAPICRVANL